MNEFVRDALVLFLKRLRQIEEDRRADLPMLIAAVRTLRSLDPAIDQRFKAEARKLEEQHDAGQVRNLNDIYDEAIRLLTSPDLNEKESQEKFRRLLESFDGPPQ